MKLEDMIIISVDDHIVEPPDLFERFVPAKWRDKAPRIRKTKEGADVWQYEKFVYPNFALNAVAGRPREELGFEPSTYDQIRKGCWDPKSRVDDMNVNGIASALCFGSVTGMAGEMWMRATDKQAAYACLQAYNDWYLEDWCQAHPGRFIPMIQVPLWDVNLAVEEVRRAAKNGVTCLSFPGLPELLKLPTIHDTYWYPLWKTVVDEGVVLCFHIGTGGGSDHISMESPIDAFLTKVGLSAYSTASEWLWSQTLRKFPDLRIVLSEGGVGWIPYMLERADLVYKNHGPWTRQSFGGKLPSEFFRERFYACFIEDEFALEVRNQVGIEIITYECDYPHADITWPGSPEQLWEDFAKAKCSPKEIDMITYQNAIKALRFDPVGKMGGKEKATVGALRAQAKHVDLSPLKNVGGVPPVTENKVVTAADVMKQLPMLFEGSVES
ncbi:MAG: amidohydrolase family protein [Steroidobacteraceae bacterium]